MWCFHQLSHCTHPATTGQFGRLARKVVERTDRSLEEQKRAREVLEELGVKLHACLQLSDYDLEKIYAPVHSSPARGREEWASLNTSLKIRETSGSVSILSG